MKSSKQLYDAIKQGKVTNEEAIALIEDYEIRINTGPKIKGIGETQLVKEFFFNDPLLKDHIIFNEQILMGVAHFSLQLDYAQKFKPNGVIHLKRMLLSNAVMLKNNEVGTITVSGEKAQDTINLINRFSVFPSKVNGKASSAQYVQTPTYLKSKIDIERLKNASLKVRSGDLFYKHSQQKTYGPGLFNVKQVWDLEQGVFAEIILTEIIKKELNSYYIHPGIFDACHVASSYILGDDPVIHHQVPLLVKEGKFRHDIKPQDLEHTFCFIEKVTHNDQIAEMNITLYNLNGDSLFTLTGFTTKKVPNKNALLGKSSKELESSSASIQQPESGLTGKIAHSIRGDSLKEKIQNYLKQKLAPLSGNKAVNLSLTKNFMDMGFDSNNMIETAQDIEKEIGIELYPTLFFEYQNIEDLSGYFSDEQKEKFDLFFGDQQANITEIGDKKTDIQASAASNNEIQADNRDNYNWRSQTITQNRDFFGKTDYTEMDDDIAIIGMSGYFADSENLDQFWRHLEAGHDLVTEIPKSHWDYRPWYDENRLVENKTYSKWGSFIEDIDKFDPLFFGIPPRQAEWLDPQLRLLIQSVQETIEDAGLAARIKGTKTGVYVGCCFQEYWDEIVRAQIPIIDYQHNSSAMSSLSGYISYTFDFQGGSIPLDNACASSLTALHLGCQSLKTGENDMAVVAGINVLLSPLHYVYFSRMQALSPSGRCHTFDKKADGYVPGEGIVSVLIKPLHKALKDRDNIHAVIKGTAINHTGRSNNSTSPRPELQLKVILDAWQKAKIDPETIGYIEAHGTGTQLGDPIEINALKRAFRKYTDKKAFCAIGSAKAHIGHLEGAAGLAGVIKVVLSMKHGKIPMMPNFKELNPYIKIDDSPLFINTELIDWKIDTGKPRRAGVSSFGMTGNNVHTIIEEFIAHGNEKITLPLAETNPVLVPLSAKNDDRLRAYAQNLLSFLQTTKDGNNKIEAFTSDKKSEDPSETAIPYDINMSDLSYTMQVGREAMNNRVVFVVENTSQLIQKLEAFVGGEEDIEGCIIGQVKKDKDAISPFVADEDIMEAIEKWISKGKLSKIGALWSKGMWVDWDLFYNNDKPQRISLPTYPFDKESYWMPKIENRSKSGAISDRAISLPEESMEKRTTCLLKKNWAPCSATHTRKLDGNIAILATKETKEIATRLSTQLEKSHILDFNDSKWQFQQQENTWENYTGCIDLAGCGKYITESKDWIPWLQKLIEHGRKNKLKLLCVTKGLESHKNNAVNLSGGSRVGLYRMLQSEYGHLESKHMDLDPSMDDKKLTKQIISEFSMDSEDSEICYREGIRYRAFLQEIEEKNVAHRTMLFPEGHVLWITGGTKGLGYLCAQHFVKYHSIKHLVLTGREKIPPREQWDTNIQQNTSFAKKIHAIRALENQGVHVKVLSVSLTNKEDLKKSLEMVKKTIGPIGGILHCAGVNDIKNPAFVRKSIQGIQQVLDPKVSALDTLYQGFCHEPLQFFILFSSVSAIIPTLAAGQSDYAMANAYMDYFAEAKKNECPIISIQWPIWKESEMGRIKSRAYEKTGMLSHTNKEGLQILDKILSEKIGPVVLPAVVNAKIWAPDQLMKHVIKDRLDTVAQARNTGKIELSKISGTLLDKTQAWLIMLFSQELKVDESKIDVDTTFQEYGMDSILIAQAISQMDKQLVGAAIDPTSIIEYPTIKSLSRYLVASSPKAVTSLFSENVEEDKHLSKTICEQKMDLPLLQQKKENGLRQNNKLHQRHKIAIVGMACHFPSAINKDIYWENLCVGRSGIKEIPLERWDIKQFYQSGYAKGKSISKWGGFIQGIEEFDAGYFGFKEEEAICIDPLVRKLLEVGVQAFRDAGYKKKELWGKNIGVFVGSRISNYSQKIDNIHKNSIVGLGQNFIAAHLSHIYNFSGPNLVVDTACSSSLVSIHLACQSLTSRESEMAIAGGVDILLDEKPYIMLSEAQALSPDGVCYTFDEKANGFVPGEGCGAVILKPYENAISDGDNIYAVIESTAVNNDGNTMGITTPNPRAQQAVIKTALEKGGIDPETIEYIETHGTGTLIGDPIELKALTEVFQSYTDKRQFCAVGSVKTNIGHLLSAAGIAGLMKVILSIYNKKIVPSLNCDKPNPRFDFEKSPFYPSQKLTDWNPAGQIRRAGISSFGFGGTNAHVIVGEAKIENSRTHQVQRKTLSPEIFRRKRYWPKVLDHKSQRKTDIHKESFEKYLQETVVENGMERKIFEIIISNENYVVRDHHVHNVRILPGVTYLDVMSRLIGKYFAEQISGKTLNLMWLTFKEPLATSDDIDQTVRISFIKKDEIWKIKIQIRKICRSKRAENNWKETAECELIFENESSRLEKIDIDIIKKQAITVHDMDDLYKKARRVDIKHGVFMKTLGSIYKGKESVLMELWLSDLAGEYSERLSMHPALLDASTFLGIAWEIRQNEDKKTRPYIPIMIEKFSVFKTLPEKCYVYAMANKKLNNKLEPSDIYYYDYGIYNDKGFLCAEVKNLCLKKIRSKELIQRLTGVNNVDTFFNGYAKETEKEDHPAKALEMRSKRNEAIMKEELNSNDRADEDIYEYILRDLKEDVAKLLNIDKDEILNDANFYDQGLESGNLMEIAQNMEEKIGSKLYPTLLFEYPTIEELARYFSENFEDVYQNRRKQEYYQYSNKEEKSVRLPAMDSIKTKIKVKTGERMKNFVQKNTNKKIRNSDIAVIGISGRYPMANDLKEFWHNVRKGKNCITEIPSDHWDMSEYFSAEKLNKNKTYSKWGGFVEDVDKFDCLFFKISPKEAETLDPQLRLLLETSWQCIEDAGYTPEILDKQPVGVYIGVMNSDYSWVSAEVFTRTGEYVGPGCYGHELANRISYALNCHGPSMTIQTACSSSLTAVHLARKSLIDGECDVALAGGVNLSLHVSKYLMLSNLNILSAEGKEKTFDHNADGYVPGEGVGCVLLKPLSKAIEDGDQIYGVLKASSVNHSGKGAGKYIPNLNSISNTFEKSLMEADIPAEQIRYIETHGTGTALGDPIELKALSNVIEKHTDKKNYCALGTKANIGHLESVSGICSLTKVLLSIKNGCIPKCANVSQETEKYTFANSPFFIPQNTIKWEKTDYPYAAGINSFGIGGSNSFLIVEGYENKESIRKDINQENRTCIIVLSAKNEERLKEQTGRLLNLINEKEISEAELTEISYTLQVGRVAMEERLAIHVRSIKELEKKLRNFLEGLNDISGLYRGNIKQYKKMINYFEADEDMARLVDAWITNRRFNKLLDLWVKGLNFDWNKFYDDNKPRRISLPTYPFARERHWIDEMNTESKNDANNTKNRYENLEGDLNNRYDDMEITENMDDMCLNYYNCVWENAKMPPIMDSRESHGYVLIFDTDNNLKDLLMERLKLQKDERHQVVLVKPGEKFRFIENESYEVKIDSYVDYKRLVEELNNKKQLPSKIIHRFSKSRLSGMDGSLDNYLSSGVFSLFHLSKALMEQRSRKEIKLLYLFYNEKERQVSSNKAFSMDYINILNRAISGFARSVRLENPMLMYKSVEIKENNKSERKLKQYELLDLLWREFHYEDDGGIEISYEDGQRRVKCLGELVLNKKTMMDLPIKEGGVYLITGGIGGLGLIFARYLAEKFKAKLVLAGRSDLDDNKKNEIDKIKSLGSDVVYIKSDVSIYLDVERLISETKQRYGKINGIIHSAGIIQDAFILKKKTDQMKAVFSPKISGTLNLDEVTKDEKLDFFVLFSSISAIWGNIGQSDYAYANCFMDEFSRAREKLKCDKKRFGKTLSINWPLWKDGGMRMDEAASTLMEKKIGIFPLKTENGIKAFEQLLVQDISQGIIIEGNKSKIDSANKQMVKTVEAGTSIKKLKQDNTKLKTAPMDANENKNIREKVERDLLQLTAELLKVDERDLDIEDDLSEYGVDSIMIMTIMSQVEQMYEETIDPNSLIEYPTIRSFSEYLINSGIAESVYNGKKTINNQKTGNYDKERFQESIHFTENNIENRNKYFRSYDVATPDVEKNSDKIAIISAACRFPSSNSLESFWENLRKGNNLITEIPEDRWNLTEFYSPDKNAPNKTYSKWGGFIDDIDLFDAEYFGISDIDAIMMDPQQRLLMELSLELLERGGYNKKEISQTRTGVFIGGSQSNYINKYNSQLPEEYLRHVVVNNIQNMMAARISDFFNLKGTSQTIDTACSSSLVSIHQACQGIRTKEIDMAIAGGIELILDPFGYIGFSKAGVLSDEGLSYVFDERSKGIVLGEGAGIVLMKSYDAAIADGDQILAVILGSSVNNDGYTMGITVPNIEGQKAVIQQAIDNSGISPDSITYLEAHGAGTLLGDPIEIKAATNVYSTYTPEKQYCAVGSVKSNIGHLLRASGIASLIKVVLSLQNKMIPPTLNCSRPHPRFKFKKSPFFPATMAKEWIPKNGIRRAGISSFGFGGTNCHVIVEEFNKFENADYGKRKPLPFTRLNRKKYWLGKEKKEKINDFNEAFYYKLMKDLGEGRVSYRQAIEMI